MTIWTNHTGSNRVAYDAFEELDRFERISHRRQGECPVRSHTSRTRARMRSRGGPGARQRSRSVNGAHRRSRYKYISPTF